MQYESSPRDVCSTALTIVSGGQTGVDRTALDVAMELGIEHDGWCPRGRNAEDGPISSKYALRETPSTDYSQRTRWNIRDSDATVVFSIDSRVRGGTALTIGLAERLGRPCLHLARVQNSAETAVEQLRAFVLAHEVERLNVAGPRVSIEPGAADYARGILRALLSDNRS